MSGIKNLKILEYKNKKVDGHIVLHNLIAIPKNEIRRTTFPFFSRFKIIAGNHL